MESCAHKGERLHGSAFLIAIKVLASATPINKEKKSLKAIGPLLTLFLSWLYDGSEIGEQLIEIFGGMIRARAAAPLKFILAWRIRT